MTAYAVTWDGAYNNVMVARCADLDAAKAAVESSRANGGKAVAAEADLDLNGPGLVGLYNGLSRNIAEGKNENLYPTVTRFTTRGDGQRRVFALLEQHFSNAPEAAAPPTVDTPAVNLETTSNEDDMATKGKKTAKKAPRVKKEKAAPKGVDQFGLRKDSKNSQAAAMFARAKGATMADVKEALGDTFYGMLGKLQDAGHKVKKDGKTIFLTAK